MRVQELDVFTKLSALFLAKLGIGTCALGHQERQDEGPVGKVNFAFGKCLKIIRRCLAFLQLDIGDAALGSILDQRCCCQGDRGAAASCVKCQICLCQNRRRRQRHCCCDSHFLQDFDHRHLP